MKLLLTSAGLKNQKIRDFFVAQFDQLEDKKACLIFTIREESDWQWLDLYDNELNDIGLAYDRINLSEDKNLSGLRNYDIYYVCGGNTFFILDRMRKTGLDRVLIEAVKNGKFYVGVSAGSIIPGPDIEVANLGDPNDLNLEDLTGLKLVPYIITPHYQLKEKSEVENFREKRKGEKVIPLTDDQAIFVEDDKMVLV
jgi:dipeptidase E